MSSNDPRPQDDGTGRLQAWQARERARQAAADAAYWASPEGRIEHWQRKIDAAYMMQTDQGIDATATVADATAKIAEIRDEMAAEDAQQETAEWTPEVTAQRRATWNALVKSGALTATGKYSAQISPAKVAEQERKQGWTVADLRAAVARLAK